MATRSTAKAAKAASGNAGPPDPASLLAHYREMLLIRRFEEKAGQLYGMGLIGGFCHLYIGQEAVAVGIQSTVAALRAVDPEIVAYHVDATDLYTSSDPTLTQEVALRQSLVFLALDLVTGQVDEAHPLQAWLMANGARPAELEAIREAPASPAVIGLNLYPIFTRKELARDRSGRLRTRMPYAQASLIEDLSRMYYARYGVPLAISETATKGAVARRIAWLEDSVAACERLRAEGIPITGYTWWPLFSLVAWAWRQGSAPIESHLLPMGLYDLDPADLTRRRTPVADRFAALTRQPAAHAGRPAAKIS